MVEKKAGCWADQKVAYWAGETAAHWAGLSGEWMAEPKAVPKADRLAATRVAQSAA